MPALIHVPISPISPVRFGQVLEPERYEELREAIERARVELKGRVIWNVNSTARGGGVAEMLQSLLTYARGAGIDARWVVISGGPDFFRITKRIHNHLHGSPGDGGQLGSRERDEYESALKANSRELAPLVGAGDIVILHDPQTAGLLPALAVTGARLIWRCHVGVDVPNDLCREAWRFLSPYLAAADVYVFSRRAFVWEGLDEGRTWIVPPSIDPFSPKNETLDEGTVAAILDQSGIVQDSVTAATPLFVRQSGSVGRVERRADMFESSPMRAQTEIVAQVSRWDRLKDPIGVMRGFVEHVVDRSGAHLVLAGPAVEAVADDPEGADVLREVVATREALPVRARDRVHIACLPMHDPEENAAIVNALRRRADVVVQKSLAEGFGLTVSEAMWKARPVVASRIGGIQDQIEHRWSGLLLDDPSDLAAFGEAVHGLLSDATKRSEMGRRARERVRQGLLGDRHLRQYESLIARLVASPDS